MGGGYAAAHFSGFYFIFFNFFTIFLAVRPAIGRTGTRLVEKKKALITLGEEKSTLTNGKRGKCKYGLGLASD